ncbi:SIS domain-containing protein [Acidobacteriota bacterium]
MDYQHAIDELASILGEFFKTKGYLFEKAVYRMVESLKSDHKILVFGNGGSASQAQHFAAELVNKFIKVRPALRAISLTTDTSALTSIANDTSFDFVFSRQIEALGDKGDIALGLTTSGSSQNVIEALKTAKEKELFIVALTGSGRGKLSSLSDYELDVPSQNTPRIQEAHLFLLHLLVQKLEERLYY